METLEKPTFRINMTSVYPEAEKAAWTRLASAIEGIGVKPLEDGERAAIQVISADGRRYGVPHILEALASILEQVKAARDLQEA